MTSTISVVPMDPDKQRKAARAAGETDGKRNNPTPSQEPVTAIDHRRVADDAVAATTARLLIAGHLAQGRVRIDESLSKRNAETSARTTTTSFAREKSDRSSRQLAAYVSSLPASALNAAMPRWAAHLLTGALGIGSGVGTTASLLSVTEDTPFISVTLGIVVALATVVCAMVVGHLLAKRDIDDRKPGKFATLSKRFWVVLSVVALGAVLIATGVAGLRSSASEADAERRTNNGNVTVGGSIDSPDEEPSGSTSEPTSVPVQTWLAIEPALVAAAIGVEYVSQSPRRQHRDELQTEADNDLDDWRDAHARLSTSAGQLQADIARRSDLDAAVQITGDAHVIQGLANTNEYRYGNHSVRGAAMNLFPDDEAGLRASRSQQGDAVFEGLVGADVPALVDQIEPRSLVLPANVDPTDHRFVLWQAHVELRRSPVIPELEAARTTPHAGEEALLDPDAMALRKAIADLNADDDVADAPQLRLFGADGRAAS